MTNTKIYHIYAKDKCLFHSVNEEDFEKTWKNLHHLLDVIDGNYSSSDLNYEELIINKELSSNSSY